LLLDPDRAPAPMPEFPEVSRSRCRSGAAAFD
jgi:hypothetical protein